MSQWQWGLESRHGWCHVSVWVLTAEWEVALGCSSDITGAERLGLLDRMKSCTTGCSLVIFALQLLINNPSCSHRGMWLPSWEVRVFLWKQAPALDQPIKNEAILWGLSSRPVAAPHWLPANCSARWKTCSHSSLMSSEHTAVIFHQSREMWCL